MYPLWKKMPLRKNTFLARERVVRLITIFVQYGNRLDLDLHNFYFCESFTVTLRPAVALSMLHFENTNFLMSSGPKDLCLHRGTGYMRFSYLHLFPIRDKENLIKRKFLPFFEGKSWHLQLHSLDHLLLKTRDVDYCECHGVSIQSGSCLCRGKTVRSL